MLDIDGSSPPEEINRHKLASERFAIIRRFLTGSILAADGAQALGISKSQFYKLAACCHGETGYKKLVRGKRGRKKGGTALDPAVESLIEEMFGEHFKGPAATYSTVWSACQAEADARKIVRPSYYTVRRRIQAKNKRLLFELQYGKEAANQKFGARPGHKITKRPLEWVQFDHTVVDLLIVDDRERKKIIGRPWVSMAICLHTRVVLGFYLSLLPPSSVSVAMLIENCVLPKDEILKSMGLDKNLWPVFGLMETIHTDNAKEFVSDVLVLNCDHYGIAVKHRDIGKKHQGGHIESLIGKFMTKKIHFLPGTTGSNILMRKALDSEARAAITFRKLREFFIYQICAYHETKHSGLGCTPMEAWNGHFRDGVEPNQLPELERKTFRFKFFPEAPNKLVVSEGIELFRRFYYAPCLKDHVRSRVLVKYDPYNLDEIQVKLPDEQWYTIPCVRNNFNRSPDFEIYRVERQTRSARDGTISVFGGQALLKGRKVVKEEISATAKAKRDKKQQGLVEHDAYQKMLGSEGILGISLSDRESSFVADGVGKKATPKGNINSAHITPSLMVGLRSVSEIDYDNDPVLY
ncbi:transposase [Pseudomonas tolaasii]